MKYNQSQRRGKVAEMIKDAEEFKKTCPHCHNKYPEADNYCGDDGERLVAMEPGRAQNSGQGGEGVPDPKGSSGHPEKH